MILGIYLLIFGSYKDNDKFIVRGILVGIIGLIIAFVSIFIL